MGTLRDALVKAGLVAKEDVQRYERDREKRQRRKDEARRKANLAIESQSPSARTRTPSKLSPNDPKNPRRYYTASYS